MKMRNNKPIHSSVSLQDVKHSHLDLAVKSIFLTIALVLISFSRNSLAAGAVQFSASSIAPVKASEDALRAYYGYWSTVTPKLDFVFTFELGEPAARLMRSVLSELKIKQKSKNQGRQPSLIQPKEGLLAFMRNKIPAKIISSNFDVLEPNQSLRVAFLSMTLRPEPRGDSGLPEVYSLPPLAINLGLECSNEDFCSSLALSDQEVFRAIEAVFIDFLDQEDLI